MFSSDNSDLTVNVITDYTDQRLQKVVYNPVDTINLSTGAINLSLKVAPAAHSYLTWEVPITVEILCDFTTEGSSSCSPKLLQTQNYEDSLINICSTDSAFPTYTLDVMTFAQDLTQQDSDDEYLRFSLFTRESTNNFSQTQYSTETESNQNMAYSTTMAHGLRATSIDFWYSSNE